jgi:hypothetical protein
MVMGFALFIQRNTISHYTLFVFKEYFLIFLVVYLSIVFELVFPIVNTSFTTDIWDGVAYSIGGLFFYTTMNKPLIA